MGYAHQILTSLPIHVLGCFTDNESETQKTVVGDLAAIKDVSRSHAVGDDLKRQKICPV